MVDGYEAGAAAVLPLRGGLEIDVPQTPQLTFRIDEIKQAAAEAPHCGNLQLTRSDRLAERRVAQLLGAVERGARIVDLQAHGADRRPVRDLMGMREALLITVENKIDAALRPARYLLRLVLADLAESQSGEQPRELLRGAVIRREFEKLD